VEETPRSCPLDSIGCRWNAATSLHKQTWWIGRA